jgi:hypothetical protein
MAAFLSSLLSELMVQHSSDAIVIECDRATMPARSLRKRTRPFTRPSYGRSVSSSAINMRSQTLLYDSNKKHTNKLLRPAICEDIGMSPSSSDAPTNKKRGGMWQPRRQISPCSGVLCVNEDLPTMSHRSARWCPSSPTKRTPLVRNRSDSALTCPKRPEFLDLRREPCLAGAD